MKNYSITRLLAVLLAVLGAGQAQAAQIRVNNVTVQRTVVTSDPRIGNCMAILDKQLSSFGLACVGRQVTFSCDGVLTSKDVAWRMFDVAQLASVRKLLVNLTVDDTHKAPDNGTCFASRVELMPPK